MYLCMEKYLFSLLFCLAPLLHNPVKAAAALVPLRDSCHVATPVLGAARDSTCAGQPVLLWATGCDGVVVWSNGLRGDTIVSRPATTRVYTAYCRKDTCRSDESSPLTIAVPIPDIPILNAAQRTICAGGSTILMASGCRGMVVWSNGMQGREITVRPAQSTAYTAVCRTGARECISCFAEPIEIRVADAVRPVLIPSRTSICATDTLSLRVAGCPGVVRWSDAPAVSGAVRVVSPTATTQYRAICQVADCSFTTNMAAIRVAPPPVPILEAERTEVCAGESVKVTASGCEGVVKWSNGRAGSEIMVTPSAAIEISAQCAQGDCLGGASSPLVFTVHPKAPAPLAVDRTNECPYVTLDLMTTLKTTPRTPGGRFEFYTAATSASAPVAHPGVAGAGTYYVFERTTAGCYSEPVAVTVTLRECPAPVPVCAYFPSRVRIEVDSSDNEKSPLYIALPEGMATSGLWSTSGSGIFNAADSLRTTYVPSGSDGANGGVTLTFTTDDPDGEGPCQSAVASVRIVVKTESPIAEITIDPAERSGQGAASVEVTPGPGRADPFIPEGFSPNGDGINDRFVISHVPAHTTLALEVYNRWGQLVYRNDDYRNDWDGKTGVSPGAGKQLLAAGSYFYIVRLSNGREFVKFMTITH